MAASTDVLRIVPTRRLGRVEVDPQRLTAFVARVLAERRHYVDAWEVTAVIESLGYNDTRLREEFGFEDTLTAGRHVFIHADARVHSDPAWTAEVQPVSAIVIRGALSSLIYSIPWMAVFVAQTRNPEALALPGLIAPSFALALIFSLIVSGGFVQAIVRRGEFYIGIKQPRLARETVEWLIRLGIGCTVGAAIVGGLVARYFDLASWSALILGIDAFVALSALWMVCATFTVHRAQWRVAAAFLGGFAGFATAKAMGADSLTAQLVAGIAVLLGAVVQARGLFARECGAGKLAATVRRPRPSVVAYWTMPYFWYGMLYFAFLFADRLTAGTARAISADASFGIPPFYVLGMELALVTLLIAASGIEVAGGVFGRGMAIEAQAPFDGRTASLAGALRRHHARAIAIALVTFVVSACAVAWLAPRLLPDGLSPEAWSTLIIGDVAYGFVAIGFVNALALFQAHRPWAPVRALGVALVINLVSGYVFSHMFGTSQAVVGLLLGAIWFAAASMMAVLRALKHADYSYTAG